MDTLYLYASTDKPHPIDSATESPANNTLTKGCGTGTLIRETDHAVPGPAKINTTNIAITTTLILTFGLECPFEERFFLER